MNDRRETREGHGPKPRDQSTAGRPAGVRDAGGSRTSPPLPSRVRRAGRAATAEDATQQALIAIWRYLPRLRDSLSFDGWAYRLLVRACYAEAKRRPTWLPQAAVTDLHEPAAPDEYLGVVRRDQLERGFGRLSVEHRAVIVMRYMLDWPLEQVADALDVSVGTVGSRLDRALKALRAALEADARPVSPAATTRSGR